MVDLSIEQLAATLQAVGSVQRLHILASLADEPLHMSELARTVQMSRALLYMHVAKLEAAGFITTRLELSASGTALKFVLLQPFSLTIDIATILAAVEEPRADSASDTFETKE